VELRRLWLLVWRRKLLVVALVIAALAAGYEATPRQAHYRATAVLFVGVPEYSSAGVFSNDLQLGSQELAATFATMVPSLGIAQAAVAATGVPRSPGAALGETTSSLVGGTSLIHVSVTDSDPVVARDLANGVAKAFVAEVLRIDPVTVGLNGQSSAPIAPVSITDGAILPTAPLSNGLGKNLALSGIFGLLVGIGIVLVLDYLDLSARTPEDLESKAGLPVLGVIPQYPELTVHEELYPDVRIVGTESFGVHSYD
jgi:capsular polysaccharide biosynthesis protein